jgi:hypothetical protein
VIVAHQYRDQLDVLNQGSTLNVANFIVLRVSGRDGGELASQFDNTPPPPEKVMEPIYRPYKQTEGGEQLYTLPKSTTGAGSFYHEIERIVRLYSDMQAEQANQLSIAANFRAHCRLVEDRELAEYQIETQAPLGVPNPQIARQIRQQTLKRGQPKAQVETDIARRIGPQPLSFGNMDDYPSREKIEPGPEA